MTTHHIPSATRVRLYLGIALALGAAAFPASALASDSIQITTQTATPEQGVPVQISFSGTAAAADNGYNDQPGLFAIVRPGGGIPCQDTFSDDQAAAGGDSTLITGASSVIDLVSGFLEDDLVGPGSFGPVTGPFTPSAPGSYLVCAWISDDAVDGTTATAVQSATFSARGPQVSQLTVTLPQPARPNVAFQIAYTTQTDQQLTLESDLTPAGGLPCASSYELEAGQNQVFHDLLDGGQSVFGGPTTTTATATEKNGSYVICTWIEGPNQGEVDATLSTPIYVGTPPPPPPCVVPAVRAGASLTTVETRLGAAHCAAGPISDKHSKSVPTGDVLKLGRRSHTTMANGAAVPIVVSSGSRRTTRKHRR